MGDWFSAFAQLGTAALNGAASVFSANANAQAAQAAIAQQEQLQNSALQRQVVLLNATTQASPFNQNTIIMLGIGLVALFVISQGRH